MSTTPAGRLTGIEAKYVRFRLKESQAKFAKRLDVSQPAINRMEKRNGDPIDGPENIIIRQIAAAEGIDFDMNSEHWHTFLAKLKADADRKSGE